MVLSSESFMLKQDRGLWRCGGATEYHHLVCELRLDSTWFLAIDLEATVLPK